MSEPLTVLMDAKYDSLFKSIITAEWCVKSDGHVESPQGYFSITEIPEHPGELKDMQEAVEEGMRPFTDWPPAGWYFTVEDSNGMIRVYQLSKAQAEQRFESFLKEFTEWEAY